MTAAEGASRLSGLPPAKILKTLDDLSPQLQKRILDDLAVDGRHIRRIAWCRLSGALLITSATLGATVYLARIGSTWPSTSAAFSGMVVVSITLITGRAPKIPRVA